METNYEVKIKYQWFDWYETREWKQAEIIEIIGSEKLLNFIAFHKFRSGGSNFELSIKSL